MADLDRAGLQILSRTESLALLATSRVGRLGISWRSLPLVLPVLYVVDDERIFIRTWNGGTLSRATDGNVVAFEADGASGDGAVDWSVIVTGMATHVADRHLPAGLSAAPADRLLPDGPSHGVSISPDQLSGRRIRQRR